MKEVVITVEAEVMVVAITAAMEEAAAVNGISNSKAIRWEVATIHRLLWIPTTLNNSIITHLHQAI